MIRIFFLPYLGNRSKSDPCSFELFCLESHILSFPKVLQIPPESPCIYRRIYCVKILVNFKQSLKAVRTFDILHAGRPLLHLYRHNGYCRRDKSSVLKGRERQSVGTDPPSSFHKKKNELGIF